MRSQDRQRLPVIAAGIQDARELLLSQNPFLAYEFQNSFARTQCFGGQFCRLLVANDGIQCCDCPNAPFQQEAANVLVGRDTADASLPQGRGGV